MAAAANSFCREAQGSEQGLLLFSLLLLLSVMTFVGRRIRVEGLVFPRGESQREGEEWRTERGEKDGSGWREWERQRQADRSVDYGNMN